MIHNSVNKEPSHSYMYGGEVNKKFFMKSVTLPDTLEYYNTATEEWKPSLYANKYLIELLPVEYQYRWRTI